MYQHRRIGEILVDQGAAQPADIERALRTQRERGGKARLGELLISAEVITPAQLGRALSIQLDYPFMEHIPADQVDLSLLATLSLAFARENRALPIRREPGGDIVVATDDPLALEILDEVRFLVGGELSPLILPSDKLTDLINNAFELKSRQLGGEIDDFDKVDSPAAQDEGLIDIKDLLEASDDDDEAPVIRFVNNLFVQSVRERASDIHIEPAEKELKVRFRVDGVLKEMYAPPKRFQSSITTRIKIMASLNIAEKRIPQDGRIRIKIAGKDIDIRVATAPSVYGERITMRLLDKSNLVLDINDIGFAPDQLEQMKRLIRRPHGIILVTGPTGSGKTTTLYSSLNEINTPDKNILTVEDPVEYQVAGISQMQVNPKIDLTFASGLRSYLRHDPDVIMVGEIRDGETAEMAIQASLTGHLVFSTLHTNDAAGAFTRLTDMGVEPFLVASSVIAAMAQRLVRRLCKDCKEPYRPSPDELAEVGLTLSDLDRANPDGRIFRPREGGCPTCNGLGYRGRAGIYELLLVEDNIKRLVINRADNGTIGHEARLNGMRTLKEDGALKVLRGLTSIAEVVRVTADGEEKQPAKTRPASAQHQAFSPT